MHLERRTKKRFISPPNTLPVEDRAVIDPFQEIPSSSSSKPAGIKCCAGFSGAPAAPTNTTSAEITVGGFSHHCGLEGGQDCSGEHGVTGLENLNTTFLLKPCFNKASGDFCRRDNALGER